MSHRHMTASRKQQTSTNWKECQSKVSSLGSRFILDHLQAFADTLHVFLGLEPQRRYGGGARVGRRGRGRGRRGRRQVARVARRGVAEETWKNEKRQIYMLYRIC